MSLPERQLIQAVRAQTPALGDQLLGIGDDCCAWTPNGRTCLSTDSVVEGVHFTADTDAAAVGRKAAASALSDLAAMGARPVGAVVALHAPAHWDGLAVMQGVQAELGRHDCLLLGGDTTRANELVVNVTVWGEAAPQARLLHRSGAGIGDILAVTGSLGGSLHKGRHLRPEPRLIEGQWLAGRDEVHAMMDISDGLAGDAQRMAEASSPDAPYGVVLLPDSLPIHADVPDDKGRFQAACCDGEDYELLLAVDAAVWPQLQLDWPFANLSLRSVGWLVPDGGLQLEINGRLQAVDWQGFEHGA